MIHNKYSVVLIDDEEDLLDVLSLNLKDEFHVQTFTDSHAALSFLEKNSTDAIVLDYHMPGRNAVEVYNQLRLKKHVQPVIFLTGETDLSVKIQSLNSGVDDFLHKPITSAELSAYLKNRIKAYKDRHPQSVKIENLEINLKDPHVKLDGKTITLTPKEYEILTLLVSQPNTVIKRADFVNKIWSEVKVEENNIDTHMSNLRKKMSTFKGRIQTIKCIGYVLRM